tara:strand:+ start:163 stop:8913 length:8751 start_codon:yes stop_codon:yes gene_type:complete
MASDLEKRGAESVATARSNERREAPSPDLSDRLYELKKSRQREQILMKEKGEDYGWGRKVLSNVAIPLGAAEGVAEMVDYAFGSPGDSAWFAESNKEMLNQNKARQRFLSDWAASYGEEAARKLDQEDRDFLDNVTVDQPKVLKDQNFPTSRNRQGGTISDFLGHTVNEGFENSPLYKANPRFWEELKGSSHYDDIETTYNNQYEFRRKLDFPLYGAFIEAHKIFTDEVEALVKKDASLMQGWEEDFLAMGAGTIQFLSQIVGLDDDQVGMTPWETRWKAGKMLTGGLAGTAVAGLQPDANNKVMGIALPQLARKPAILAAVVGPGLVRALSAGKGTRLGRAIERRRELDPSFDAFMSKAEAAKAAVAGSVVGQAAKAIGDIPLEIPGTGIGLKVRDASAVIKEGGKKTAQYSEEVAGALRTRKVADLVKSGAKGSLYWMWSGAPELGLIHPIVGSFHGALLNSAKYGTLLDSVRSQVSRRADKAQTDAELAEQVGQAESTMAQASADARSTAAAFVLGLDEINQYGTQAPGGISVLDSPRYLERVQRGEGVLGSDSIAGLPAAEVILPPNANLPTRSAAPTPEVITPPPPKGVEAFIAPEVKYPSLSSPTKVARRVRALTDDSRLLLMEAIGKNLHKTNPEGFLDFLSKLPVKTRRLNQQYIRQNEIKTRSDKAPEIEALAKSAQETVKSAFNSQYRRNVLDPVPEAPRPLKAPEKPATRQEPVFDTTRYTMELPDGSTIRVVSEAAQVLDNQVITRNLVLEEARQIKAEIQNRIDGLEAADAKFGTFARETLDEAAAARQPLFDVVEAADAPPSQWRTVDDAQPSGVDPSVRQPRVYGVDIRERPGVASVEAGAPPQPGTAPARRLEVSDSVPGAVRLPDPTNQARMEWANRARLKEIAHLKESLALVDDAAHEFLTGEPRVKRTAEEGYNLSQTGGSDFQPQRTAGSNAVVNTAKEILAMRLENKYLELVTEAWGKGGRGEIALQALYKNYGRSAVDAAINRQRAMFLEERTSKPGPGSKEAKKTAVEAIPAGQALDPRFPLTWDGAIIDGTPLARVVREGAVPRSVAGRGEYMARPVKRSDKPLTDESRKGEMTDYFTEAAREVEGRPTKKQREFDEARALADELKAERDAPLKAVEEGIDKAFDESWKAESRGRPQQRAEAKEKAKTDLTEARQAREFQKETGIDVGPKDVATAIDYLRRVERDPEFKAAVEKGWVPPLEEYITLSQQGAAKLKEAIKARREGRAEARKLTPEEMKRVSAAREEISSIMRSNKDLFDKKKDAKLKGKELEARINERNKVLNEVSKIWQGLSEKPAKVSQATPKAPQRTVSRQEKITREDLQNNPDTVYLFGDNLQGKGKGGQAAAMRGEPNAAGIPTKKTPSTDDGAYFTDAELKQNKAAIDAAFDKIPADKNIVIPKAGLGTGLAQLQKRAPETFKYLQQKLAKLEGRKAETANPWYKIEFEKAVEVPRNKRSKPMTNLARRMYRDPNIPMEIKQKYWDAMIRGKNPHVSPNYGKPKAPGGKPRTDAPTRYSTWHEQIKGFIKGDRIPEAQARTAGITWQASKGSKRLGTQLKEDIARIENAKDITPDQKLTALNDLRNNILDDIYEGGRKERKVYDYREADYQSALGEVRLKGKQAVVSRVGTAAINRAKETGRTVAAELAEFMETIDTAIGRAENAVLRDPGSRTSKAIVQARNIWRGQKTSNVTPEFYKAIKELKRKEGRLNRANIYIEKGEGTVRSSLMELEYTAAKKNMPIHEQIALSSIARKITAANEARHVNQGINRVANEVGINRRAERNRIETAVSAVREAMPELPPAYPPPKPKAAPKAQPKPEPAPQPKKQVKERDYKRVEEAVVPTWVKNELVKHLDEFKSMGMSKTQAEAISAGFSDVWNQGLTMLASEKARQLVYDSIVKKLEADGVTLSKTFKTNLKSQLNEYLSHFRSPFKGREKLAEYSLDLPGPESASGILEVALRTLPDEFMFTGDVWSGPVNVKQVFFEALNDLRRQKKNKDIDTIQKEAFVELGNQYAAQVQVLAQNKIINGEMARLGITRNSTPLEAAARIVVHRLLYQEAMPLGLFNRLTKEVTKTVDGVETKSWSHEPVSMKDIADLIRTERRHMVEAVKTEIRNIGLEPGRKSVKLTDNQIRRMMLEQNGPLQFIADKLDKYEYRSKIAGAPQLNDMFKEIVDPDGKLEVTTEKAVRQAKDEYKLIDDDSVLNEVLDYTYNEKFSDKVFNASFNPEYLDSMMFNARLAQNQGSFLNQFTSGMKGNITYESLMTNMGNLLGHSLVGGLLTGELPTTFYGRVARETWLFNKFRKTKSSREHFTKEWKKKYPERVEAYNDLYRYGALDGVDWGSVEAAQAGPILAAGMKAKSQVVSGVSKQLNAYRNLRRKIYQLEDNGPRIAEAVREHIQFSKELKIMDKGAYLAIPTGKRGVTIITKGDAPRSRQGTEFYRGTKNLTKEQLSQLKASYVMRKVSGRVFNYKDVPRFIRSLRAGKMGAIGAFFTPFISFPYLSIDIPGVKKGIFGSVLGDSLGNTSGYTNSPKLTLYRATTQAKQRMRVLMWGLNMNQFSHPLNADLSEMSRFNMEPGGTTATMIRSSQEPNTIGVWRWNNANIFEASMLLMRNVMAMQAQLANWHLGDKAKSNKNLEYYMRLSTEGKVLTKNDVIRLGGLSGNLFMRSILQALPKQSNQDKGWWDLEKAWGHLAASLIGVDDWNAVKTALPMATDVGIKDSTWSSFAPMIRDLEATDQLNFEDMTAQEQMDFMTANWFKAFSRLYLRQRKITGDLEVNNQARIALAAFRKQMMVPLEEQIKVARGREKEKLMEIKSMAELSHSRMVEAYSNFYTAVSELESLKRGRTKEEQKQNSNLQKATREVNNLRKSLEDARSKAVDALRKSRRESAKARELR